MNSTPRANRVHIGIYGNRNAGKSSLLNAVIGQDVSLVSDVKGTTTDPVSKPMELLPFGPVVFIDTAGLDDEGVLGSLRVERAMKVLQRTDFAIYVRDITQEDEDYKNMTNNFKRFNIPHMLVFNKTDLVGEGVVEKLKADYPKALFVSSQEELNIHGLKDELIARLETNEAEPPIVGDLVPYNGKVVMVVPIDSEAPKGRIILPQVQVIRDCLDHGIKTYTVRDTELEEALQDLKDIDLVITDSQAFKEVRKIVPQEIPLTSFSIVFARHKGELGKFIDGVEKLKALKNGSKVLISESCTHNHSHEDIGRVKIPRRLNAKLGIELDYTFKMGHDFPKDIADYDLVIHCGSCMLNRKTMLTRIQLCEESQTAITNYGVVLAFINDILDDTTEMFAGKM